MLKSAFGLFLLLVASAFGLTTTASSAQAADPCDTSALTGFTVGMLNVTTSSSLEGLPGIYAGDFNGKVAVLIIEDDSPTANYFFDGARIAFQKFEIVSTDPPAIRPLNRTLLFTRNSDGSLTEQTFFGDKTSTTLTKCPPAQ